MRWLFWFLLVTLSTLLGRVDASSVTKASTAQINVSTLVNHEATIHALPVEHNPNIKRNLRGTVMKTTTVYPSPQKNVNGEEERALPAGNMLDRVKKTMSQPLRNGIDKAK
ncbi:RxLR effector protein, partial [Phytophthora megakarya]